MSTLPRLRRSLLSLSFALAVAAVPISQVAACSCAVGETADVIRAAQLAFIGTVADQPAHDRHRCDGPSRDRRSASGRAVDGTRAK